MNLRASSMEKHKAGEDILEAEAGEAGIYEKALPESRVNSEQELKTTADGKIILVPQPSSDPADPLNWSWWKKHSILFSILPGCLLTDGLLTWGSTMFVPQAMEWHMTPPEVANSLSPGVFMQGPGGLLAVPLCQRYGRLPVLFWSQFLTLVCTIAANFAPTYAGFTAARTLQGFFGAAPQIIGLSVIYDLFFWHERARKINIWAFFFLVGPYVLPLISALVVDHIGWRPTWGILCGISGFSVLTIVIFGEETLYHRDGVHDPPRARPGGWRELLGVAGYRARRGRPTVWRATKDLFSAIFRPYLLLPTFGFVMFTTMWSIGIVTTISLFILPPPYAFSNNAYALLFFAPLIGTLAAEIWGHWFNDFIASLILRRSSRNGDQTHYPEYRLWAVYPSALVGVGGLVLYGQAFQHTLPWPAIAFGWGMAAFSVLGTTTPISAYVIDVFPKQAAGGSGWILMARVAGGFSVTYFQTHWVAQNGPAVTFGLQGGILGFALVSVVALQIFGQRLRAWWPVPEAKEA